MWTGFFSNGWRQASLLLAALSSAPGIVTAAGYDVDWSDTGSVKDAARTLAFDTMSYYKGNLSGQTIGILPGPPPNGDYYWWEAGNLWGSMMDYWHYTGDSTYNSEVISAVVNQAGPGNDFMSPNWTASLGNDDQGFWGMAAMTGAEVNFPNPPEGKAQYLALAQGVFNTMASPDRHDDTCGGGLRWQIYYFNNGYNYKNSIANGCFFNIAARLARYTGNTTFSDWAVKEWDWETAVGFLSSDYAVYDGGHVEKNCTDIDKAQYTYNAGTWIGGAAYMYNFTTGSTREMWKERVNGLLGHMLATFFPNDILTEIQCQNEKIDECTTDALSYKGFVARTLANVAQVAPFTNANISAALLSSAKGAVAQCTGGTNGRQCGYQWETGKYDGMTGAGQMMSALSVTIATLYTHPGSKTPVTNSTGGTSQGDSTAGQGAHSVPGQPSPVTTADRAGAGILTALFLIGAVSIFGWMCSPISEPKPSEPETPEPETSEPKTS